MTQHQLGDLAADAVVSKARAVSGSAAVNTGMLTTPANYASIAAMDARLNAISSTIYTQAKLDQMTANDKAYAIRLNDDAGTV